MRILELKMLIANIPDDVPVEFFDENREGRYVMDGGRGDSDGCYLLVGTEKTKKEGNENARH